MDKGPKYDITGQTFNFLTVDRMEKLLYQGKFQYMAICTCNSCKNTNVVCVPAKLKNGERKSCGCINPKKKRNLIGQNFGYLEVIKHTKELKKNRIGKNSRYTYHSICRCHNCGKENHRVQTGWLVNGTSTSCGCRRDQFEKIRGKNSVRFTGYEEMPGSYWTNIKRSAKSRGILFNIDKKYVWDLFLQQNKQCILSGLNINFGHNTLKTTASLDRIDSTKGYIKGNVQWVHKDINKMKWNFEEKYFIDLCEKIYLNKKEN